MRKAVWIVVFSALGLLGMSWFLQELRIPPHSLTRTRFRGIATRAGMYYKANHRLPGRLSELPERPGYDNETVDAWGTEIVYLPASGISFVLESLGTAKHGLIRETYVLGEDGLFLPSSVAATRDTEHEQAPTVPP